MTERRCGHGQCYVRLHAMSCTVQSCVSRAMLRSCVSPAMSQLRVKGHVTQHCMTQVVASNVAMIPPQ